MSLRSSLLLLSTVAWACAAPVSAQPSQPVASDKVRPAADPNQRICQDITQVGSRLATKRICATRAEWEAKRKDDRDTVDQAQRSANIGCSVVNTHTGTPAC